MVAIKNDAATAGAEGQKSLDFIRQIVADDVAAGVHGGRVATRFPPEPNGFLHIGHAKSICLNFGIARQFGGTCNLRFDDTNPAKEEMAYVESIQADVRWLGFDWEERLFYASDYFDRLYRFAVALIQRGKAYVDDQSAEQIRQSRGTLTRPGIPSPYRNRSVAENLDLFERMKNGEFPDGKRVLRAKIHMASANVVMRDPTLYRIRKVAHHRTGESWCIYPLYDFAHCLSDAIEGITHSVCTMEFENNRELYDWILDTLEIPDRPHQYEFARLNLTRTVLSKRKLLQLVDENIVDGWDDPRMPTLSGLRRRGFTPEAIRNFCDRIGVARAQSMVDYALLEHCLREDLNRRAPRVMAVLRPLKLVIENYPQDRTETLAAINNPEDPGAGSRQVPFGREIYIERDDFLVDPPKKWFRLAPGREVRLRYAYFITCTKVVIDPQTGEILELRCTYDPATRGGDAPDGRKVKGTLHWVAAHAAINAEVRLYDSLFTVDNPAEVAEAKSFLDLVNPEALTVLDSCRLEPGLGAAAPGEFFQFERLGYFCVDAKDSRPGRPVFNRSVTLRDTWAKIQQKLSKT
ncbi:MAG: glutamine--tRNA ligase/YqeY domain fusion protein [Desulfobacteraceae bacterium]|nr:glutamine--tRNA ligase/YqeY domain fusion protein [Desulfobacteraceae bacterium]